METPEVSEFRQCILDGAWASAEAALMRLGVSEEGIWVSTLLRRLMILLLISPPLVAGGKVLDQPAEIPGIIGGWEHGRCAEHFAP